MKVLTLRRPDECSWCRTALAAGTRAVWDPSRRQAHCLPCHEHRAAPVDAPPPIAPTVAAPQARVGGASAQREYDKRSAHRERQVRMQHPKLGGLLLALSTEPASTRVWAPRRGRRARRRNEAGRARWRARHCAARPQDASPGRHVVQGQHRPPGRDGGRRLGHRRQNPSGSARGETVGWLVEPAHRAPLHQRTTGRPSSKGCSSKSRSCARSSRRCTPTCPCAAPSASSERSCLGLGAAASSAYRSSDVGGSPSCCGRPEISSQLTASPSLPSSNGGSPAPHDRHGEQLTFGTDERWRAAGDGRLWTAAAPAERLAAGARIAAEADIGVTVPAGGSSRSSGRAADQRSDRSCR